MGPWWFHVHRIVMLVALLIMIAAFIIVVVYIKPGSQFRSGHAAVGARSQDVSSVSSLSPLC